MAAIKTSMNSTTTTAQAGPTTTGVGPLPIITTTARCSELVLSTLLSMKLYSSVTTQYMVLRRNYFNVYLDGGVTTTCTPGGYVPAMQKGANPIFSATACPAGYAPMCTSVATGATVTADPTVKFWPALASGDTAIGCCLRYDFFAPFHAAASRLWIVIPILDARSFVNRTASPRLTSVPTCSGYTCADETSVYSHACVSTIQPGETKTAVVYFPDIDLVQRTVISANAQTTAKVYDLKLLYATRQTQTPSQPTSTHSTNCTTDAHPSEAKPPGANPTGTPPSATHPSKGLSPGQMVAISVCAPLFLLSCLVGLFLLCRRAKKKETTHMTQIDDFMAYTDSKPELDGTNRPRLELDAVGTTCSRGVSMLSQLQTEHAQGEEDEYLQRACSPLVCSPQAGSPQPCSPQECSPQEYSELPGCDVGRLPSFLSRRSAIIRRKPVSGGPYSPISERYSFIDLELNGPAPSTAEGAPGRVVSQESLVSRDWKGKGRDMGDS
ncbi:hypothetical protein CCM_04823 [Cordyceps militaris CM01]|uniref:Uncharacterized protein n=1 Tax=Cordyceps militaris (strain CM01) TaxID=983644 RepID=G3JEV6_CORMM|nr:uncharacterized protein CCM_04823 [Cordyceps militaris CM01]EGX93449.1 hypothetical protein CCM_04823 [Cordyceps militaris CM01]